METDMHTTTKTTHTPRPWQVVLQPSKTWVGMRSVHVCAAGDPAKVMSVAHIGCISGTNPDEEANARLIAAAPEMLEALIQALRFLDIDGAPVAASLAADQARAAIARATGGGL